MHIKRKKTHSPNPNVGRAEPELDEPREFIGIGKEIVEIKNPVPRFFGDRFIPRRYPVKNDLNTQFARALENRRDLKADIIQQREDSGYWRTKVYTIVLKSVLSIEKTHMLNLTDPIVQRASERFYQINPKAVRIERTYGNLQEFDWPCKPRKRPLACPDSTHDLPGFSANFGRTSIITWSSKGSIAACFKNDLVFWTPETMKTLVYKLNNCRAISYNPDGKILAIACTRNEVSCFQLWDCHADNFIYYLTEHILTSKIEDWIECIDWDPNGKHIACGTIGGDVLVFSGIDLRAIKKLKTHSKTIHLVKYSPKLDYLAANDVTGNTFIWSGSYNLHAVVRSKHIFDACIDWHPWNGADLIITESCPAAITVFNVPTKKSVAFYRRKDRLVVIQAVLFNKISAELLISCDIKTTGEISHEILVLASLDRVVDAIDVHEDTVCYMAWSPGGTQLATASDDDVLFITNFFALKDIARRSMEKCEGKKNKNALDCQFDLYKHIR